MKLSIVAAIAALSFAPLAGAATLTHSYNFNGNLKDSVGISDLIGSGGMAGSRYNYAPGQGLAYSGGLAANYSIEFAVDLGDTSGYRKLVDFLNLGSDSGLYNLGGNLIFYPVATGSNTPFNLTGLAHVVLTRTADIGPVNAGTVTGYVNGMQRFSFIDSARYAVPTTPNLYFFQDDNVTRGNEAGSGSAEFIRIYDGVLSASEVFALQPGDRTVSAVPVPTAAVGGAGLFALVLGRRRTR